MSDLLHEQLRNHLVGADLVRDPDTAGPRPPLWLSPRGGLPAPPTATTINDVVIGAFVAPGIPPARHEGWLRLDSVDLRIRCRVAPQAIRTEQQLNLELGDRRAWQMGTLLIHESLKTRDLQMVDADDTQGMTFLVQFSFQYTDPAWVAAGRSQ
jgi:hypothetical protein